MSESGGLQLNFAELTPMDLGAAVGPVSPATQTAKSPHQFSEILKGSIEQSDLASLLTHPLHPPATTVAQQIDSLSVLVGSVPAGNLTPESASSGGVTGTGITSTSGVSHTSDPILSPITSPLANLINGSPGDQSLALPSEPGAALAKASPQNPQNLISQLSSEKMRVAIKKAVQGMSTTGQANLSDPKLASALPPAPSASGTAAAATISVATDTAIPMPMAHMLNPVLRSIGKKPIDIRLAASGSFNELRLNLNQPAAGNSVLESTLRDSLIPELAQKTTAPVSAFSAAANTPVSILSNPPNTNNPLPVFDLHLPSTAPEGGVLSGDRSAPSTLMQSGRLMEGVSENLSWMIRHDAKVAQVRLWPRDLGMINLQVKINADAVEISIEADNPAVLDELSDAAPRLRSLLADQGLGLSQLNIEQHSNGRQQTRPEDLPQRTSNTGAAQEETEDIRPPPPQMMSMRLVDVFA